MAQRGITDDEIRRALMNPDRVERDPDDAELIHARKRFFREGDSMCSASYTMKCAALGESSPCISTAKRGGSNESKTCQTRI